MKNKKPLLLTIGLSSLILAIAVSFNIVNHNFSVLQADEPNYEFYLNNNKRISNDTQVYTNEKDAYMETNLGNQIDLKVSNVIKYNDGWQTINPHGYFYNPVSELGNNNKISGIKSIKYTSNSSNELTLYYGWSINSTEIIYSLKETLTSGVEYTFDESKPSYFYIENDSESSININSLSIKYSCSEDPYPYQDLNVLMIGNSFADDTVYYAARIAQSYGINLNIFDSYIASCTIDKHYNNLLNDTAEYSMRTMNGNNWVYADNRTLGQIVDYKQWDIITFQQASAQVGRSDSYSNLTNLVNAVKNRLDYTPRLMWNLTWAYDYSYQEYYDYFSYFNNDQIQMYNAIISCYQSEVAPLGIFERIIPAGTAVQNMRSSYMGDTISRDGKHMSTVHGRFLLGLDLLSSIYGIDLYKSPCTYKPFDINQSYINTATECAYNAVKTPLQITNSQYISHEIASYDLSNYTEIDAGLVGCSYWDATSSNYNIRIQNSSGVSNKYVSTNRFTSSTLPVGSIVAIDEAFGVSLQTWINDSQQSSTMQEIYDNVITIDNNFWNGYSFRAFNIFKASKSILSGQYVDEQYSQVFDGFHIYVPNASLGNLKTKTQNDSYESDKTIFTSRYYNIDAFERIHLDPIIGFYKCDSYYYLMNSYVDSTAQRFVCTRPFHSGNNDLPENTIIILDDGYQYRSDCWTSHGTTSRPGNVTSQFTVLGPSFWSNYRTRTFNVSTISSTNVGQNAIAYMNHMRIYVPVSDDIYIEREDTATMSALGYAVLNSTGASVYGKSDIPVLVTLHGDDVNKVRVLADGTNMNATRYSYNKSTNKITISTSGSIGALGLTLGDITGTINKDAGTITNVSISGSIKTYVSNNGNISLSEMYFDRCNYSTNAASQVNWQRWYMDTNYNWVANSGSGDWTTSERTYLLDNDYSMGLRIAPSNYQKTRFTLRTDLNNGNGITPHGIYIWLYNPNSTITKFRIYVGKSASTTVGDHASPNSMAQIIEKTPLDSNQWLCIGTGFDVGKIYNISLYFESSSSATTFVYLGHVSIY